MMRELPGFTHQEISYLMFLQMGPNVFSWIEFWCISWQAFDDDPSASGDDVFGHQLGPVNRGAIPNHHKWLSRMAFQHLQEIDHLRCLDRSWMNTEENPPQADCANHREAFPAESFAKDRCLAPGCPRPHAMGPGAHSSFVDENDQTPFAAGFFLMAGHL